MMSFRLLPALSLVLLLNIVSAPNANSAIVLSMNPPSPNPLIAGGTGTIDIFISSNSGNQLLDGFQVQVGLTPTGGSPAGGLIFSSTQLDAQLGIGGVNGYVFAGNSLSQNTGAAVGTVTGGGSLYTGYDATFDLNPVTLTSTRRLLYRLNLSAISSGTYDLTANLQPSSFFTDQLDPTNTTIAFNNAATTLTVSAVPEPSSAALLGIVVFGVGMYVLKRRSQPIARVSEV